MFWHPVENYLLSLLPIGVWAVALVTLLLMLLFKPTRWYTVAGIIALLLT